MGNKITEENCFKKAFTDIEKRDKNTKKILSHLCGKNFFEEDQERPDFILLHKSKDKSQKDTIVGIEHFEIAHNSRENQNGKIIASDNVVKKEVNRIFNKYYNPDGVEITDAVISDLQSLTKKDFDMIKNSKYKDFYLHFNIHIKNTKKKLQNIMKN